MPAADTARLIASLELDNSKFLRGASGALAATGRLDKGLGRAQRGFSDLGRGVNRLGTRLAAGVAVGLAGAAKAAIDWEDAFQGVVKTVDEADLAKAGMTFDQLGESIRAMSREMPNSAIELAGIAEQAGALGIKAADIEAFTRQVAILASTTDVSADQAAAALGQLQNVIGLTGDEFDNFAASLVDLGNKGSSTESQILEIARRAGGAAKLFGIGKDAILGWAAAAANLGINSESAGTSLQNVFLKLMPKVSKGSKTIAKVFGMSAADVKKAFKKDASGALETFVRKLARLPKDARLEKIQQIFGKGTGITRLLLGFTNQVDSVSGALDTSTQAWKDATAAQEEFDKRNATVRSAISRLKNNVIDAAVTIGEGFAPALGEAADKLSTFLKSDENRELLKGIGKDVGKAIRSIDWDKVIDAAKGIASALKPALDLVLRIGGVIAGLPPEVLGAGGGFVIANKISGGLLGDATGGILGGLGESLAKGLAAKIPLFGSAFVQPVFVTNMGAGGIGGAAPTGGAGKLGKALAGASIIGDLVAVIATQQAVSQGSTQLAGEVKGTLDVNIKNMNPADLQAALNGVNQGITDLQSNPLLTLVQGDALTTLQAMKADLEAQQRAVLATPDEQRKAQIAFRESERSSEIASSALKSTTGTGLDGVQHETRTGLANTTGAVRSAATTISGAISSMPPPNVKVEVNVSPTSVEKSTTIVNRYGPTNGSYGGGTGGGGQSKYD